MTGFGSAQFETDTYTLIVEAKSVNSKSQDFSIRLPRIFLDKEIDVKNFLNTILERGKASLNVDYLKKGNIKPKLTINKELFKAYYLDLKDAVAYAGAQETDLIKIITTLPEVFDANKTDSQPEEDWILIFEQIKTGILKCDEFRIAEGKVLQNQLQECIIKIRNLSELISTQDHDRVNKIKFKIREKLDETILAGKIDENRLEQELIYYIEKLDITEEKVRLHSHLDYFEETMNSPEANGKKLGFIAQEIGREINTTGSKANDAQMQKWVIQMKEELEKIKEQTLNVL